MPVLSVLQLDTNFPRIPADVSCRDTYNCELEIIRVENAKVPDIVTDKADSINLEPFVEAISKAKGDLVTTSCGFLSPFQKELEQVSGAPFIASSLSQLPEIAKTRRPDETCILTFNASRLNEVHLPKGCKSYVASIIGLEPELHLRQVIENDRRELDMTRAGEELKRLIVGAIPGEVKTLLLECTNLPPYKSLLRGNVTLQIFDILTAIEAKLPGAIKPQFL